MVILQAALISAHGLLEIMYGLYSFPEIIRSLSVIFPQEMIHYKNGLSEKETTEADKVKEYERRYREPKFPGNLRSPYPLLLHTLFLPDKIDRNISKGMISRLVNEFAKKSEKEIERSFGEMLKAPVMHTDCTNARGNGKNAASGVSFSESPFL